MDPINNFELKSLVRKDNRKLRRCLLLLRKERIISEVISYLKSDKPNCYPFLTKVTEKIAPNYFSIIKYPMDLSTITKLKQPLSVYQFYHLIELMLDNCDSYNYNRERNIFSNVYIHGLEMRKRFNRVKSNYRGLFFEMSLYNELKREYKNINRRAVHSKIIARSDSLVYLQREICKFFKKRDYDSVERRAYLILYDYIIHKILLEIRYV